jgi:hypothetical protein
MSSLAAEHVRAPRRRGDLIRDDRLSSIDMRTRIGRRFATLLDAVKSEFGDADPARLAEVVRLRMISENAQRDCLAGQVPLDRLVRVQNLLIRAERQLTSVSRGKPAAGGVDLASYLAEIADRDDADDVEVDAEVEPVSEIETENTKSRHLESSAADEHVAALDDIPAREGVEHVMAR